MASDDPRDAPEGPSSTPSGDGPNAQPSKTVFNVPETEPASPEMIRVVLVDGDGNPSLSRPLPKPEGMIIEPASDNNQRDQGETAYMAKPFKRVDTQGRDVTDLPGLHGETDRLVATVSDSTAAEIAKAKAASKAASHDTPERETQDSAITGPDGKGSDTGANPTVTGDVLPAIPDCVPAGVESPRTHAREVAKRLQKDGRWPEIEPIRDQMMQDKAIKARFPDKESRQQWVYGELDRMYPPLKPAGISDLNPNLDKDTVTGQAAVTPVAADSGQIQGLAEIPKDWPDLPANASLAGEIGWVQANRLRIVEERPGKATRVRLDQALSPAPSWAALGWLETSIRSYAKFVDVAAKVSGSDDGDESAVMRRERRSIDEVRAILAEMMEDEDDGG